MTSIERTSRSIEPYIQPIALLGALVVVIELVTLRVLSRTAIHIPGLERVEFGYQFFSELGRIAFNAGIVLVVALALLVATKAAASGRVWLASVLVIFLAFASMAAIGLVSEVVVDLVSVIAIVAVPIACLDQKPNRWLRVWLSPTLFVIAFALAGLPSMLGEMTPGLGIPVTGLWRTAEAVVVVAGVTLLARTWGPLAGRSVLVGLVAGGVVLVSLVSQHAATETLMLWNLGLAGYFHPGIYAVAIACVAYATHLGWVVGDRSIAVGVAFIVAGGIGLHSTIQSAAFLMGIVILLNPSVVGAPEAEPRVLAQTGVQESRAASTSR